MTSETKDSMNIVASNKIDKVVVHPLVLLSVVDHFNRMGKIGNSQRVVGVLLGSLKNRILDISNSFAREVFSTLSFPLKIFVLVPFDEEEKEKDVWFLDHEYLENMYTMFRKVNGKYHVDLTLDSDDS
jgi:26S proteasome regulatory subunit N8